MVWTRPLDPLDFRPRTWVGDSGWPIDRDDIAEFYERAARICQVPGFRYEANPADPFANELGANDLGIVKSLRDNFERRSHEPPDFETGCLTLWHHHMEGTRMHADPRRGVVDSDGKVHGVANLYIAGSLVFPTSGFANLTLTIVALATRLADKVKAQLTRLGNHA